MKLRTAAACLALAIPLSAMAEPSPGELRAEAAKRAVKEGKIRYFPAKAQAAGVSGKASLDCLVEPGGWLTDCRVASEEPTGWDFGATALGMAPLFKANPQQAGSRMVLPLNFKLPE